MPSAVIPGPGVRCECERRDGWWGQGSRQGTRRGREAAKGTPVVRGFSLRSSMPRRQVRAADRPDRWTEKGRKPSGQPGACPPEHRSPRGIPAAYALFLSPTSQHPVLINHQTAVFLSQNKPAITNQPEQTSTNHQPPAKRTGCTTRTFPACFTKSPASALALRCRGHQ
jgi:hypothetical protein